MDRSLDSYTHVLSFKKVSDEEFTGEDFEQVKGVFGLRASKTEAAASAPW